MTAKSLTRTLSPRALKTLTEACRYVDDEQRKGSAPELVILAMIKLFGAKRTIGLHSTNTLRCGTVSGTCTWSRDSGLLLAWRRMAGAQLQVARASREAGQ